MEVLLRKLLAWIPSNIAGFVGIAQTILKAIREICIVLVRLVCPLIPGEADDKIIQKIADVSDMIDKALDKVKTFLLGVV